MWKVVRCPGRRPAHPRAGRPGRGRRYRASPPGGGLRVGPVPPALTARVAARGGWPERGAVGGGVSAARGGARPVRVDGRAVAAGRSRTGTRGTLDRRACPSRPATGAPVSTATIAVATTRDLRPRRARPDRRPAHRCRPARRPTSPDPRADHRRRPRAAVTLGARWAAVRRGQRSAGEHRADAEPVAGRPLIGDRHAVPGRRGAIRAAARLPAGDQPAVTRRQRVMPRAGRPAGPTGLARPAGPPRSGSRTCHGRLGRPDPGDLGPPIAGLVALPRPGAPATRTGRTGTPAASGPAGPAAALPPDHPRRGRPTADAAGRSRRRR